MRLALLPLALGGCLQMGAVPGGSGPGEDLPFALSAALGGCNGCVPRHRFGSNSAVGTTAETIWPVGGNYNWLTVADEIQVAPGGDPADDKDGGAGAQEVACECLLADFSLGDNQVLQPDGASASAISADKCIRVPRCWVSETGTYHGSNTDDITIQTEAGTTVAIIEAGQGQTEQMVETIPLGFRGLVRQNSINVESGKPATIRIRRVPNADDVSAPYSGADRSVQVFFGAENQNVLVHETWDVYAAKTDLWIEASVSAGSSAVSAELELIWYPE